MIENRGSRDAAGGDKGHGRRRRVSVASRVVLASLGLGLTVLAVGALAFEARYGDSVVPGVRVAGIDLSGLDRASASVRLDEAFGSPAGGRVVVVTPAGAHPITYTDVGRRPDLDQMLDEALAIGHGEDILGRVQQSLDAALGRISIAPRITFDMAELSSHVERVGDLVERQPRDATVSAGENGFVVQPSVAGQALRRAETTGAIARLLGEANAALSAAVEATIVTVSPSVDDAAAERLRQAAERVAGTGLDLELGDERWTIPASTVRSWLRFPAGVERAPLVSTTDVQETVAGLRKQVGRPARNASFAFRAGRVVATGRSRAGRRLDVKASSSEIAAALARKAAGTLAPSAPVELVTRPVPPALSSRDAKGLARRMVRLSTWTTPFEPSERNGFGANIRIPARAINGTVVLPGKTFDFWDAVGSVTTAKGYRPGGAIINGRTQPSGALGGGICSTSTTLFNAAARAGLEIVSRRAHFYYIDRYPVGLDATVFISSSGAKITLAFRNDTPTPILILGSSTRTSVRFDVYGISDGRSVSFSRPIVKNVKQARDLVEKTSSIPRGTRKRVEYPTDGFDSWVTRRVVDGNGRVIHRETFYSHYGRVDGVTLLGV